jgi:hypothetical protein
MSVNLRSPWTILLLIPHALRLVGSAESSMSDVAQQIVKEMYGDGPAKLLPVDHPAMPVAIEMAKAQTMLAGASDVVILGDDSIGYWWSPPDGSARAYAIRCVRVVLVEPGTNPKKPFIDYTKPERHGLQVVTIEGDSNADLLRHALRMEEERDKAAHAATSANERAEQAEVETKQVVERTATWETEAICVVPRNDQDDMVEILRRRVRTLELENEHLREVVIEPDATFRRRIALETENVKLVQALRAILVASDEPMMWKQFVNGLAHDALAEAKQTLFRTGEEALTIADWAKASIGFLMDLAKQTGAQDHEDDCGCEGCGALLLITHGTHVGINCPAETKGAAS